MLKSLLRVLPGPARGRLKILVLSVWRIPLLTFGFGFAIGGLVRTLAVYWLGYGSANDDRGDQP